MIKWYFIIAAILFIIMTIIVIFAEKLINKDKLREIEIQSGSKHMDPSERILFSILPMALCWPLTVLGLIYKYKLRNG